MKNITSRRLRHHLWIPVAGLLLYGALALSESQNDIGDHRLPGRSDSSYMQTRLEEPRQGLSSEEKLLAQAFVADDPPFDPPLGEQAHKGLTIVIGAGLLLLASLAWNAYMHRQIKQRERRAPCTLSGFTANAQAEETRRCSRAGMNDCLFKPVSLNTLSQKLAGLKPLPRDDVFDIDTLLTLTRGNPQFALRMLTELLRSSQKDRQQLLALPCEGAQQALMELAHKIKGSALMIRAVALIKSCEALEQAFLECAEAKKLELCKTALEQAMLTFEHALQKRIDRQDNPAA